MRIERSETSSRVFAALAGLGLLAVIAAGCPGTLENKAQFLTGGAGGGNGGGGTSNCQDVPSTIFKAKCDGSGCHGATNPAFALDLVSPNVADRVVGKPAMECTGILADPQDAEDSVLYTKLLDTPPCGARMPFGGMPLSDAEIACVKAWIEEQSIPEPPKDAGGGGAGGAGGGAGG